MENGWAGSVFCTRMMLPSRTAILSAKLVAKAAGYKRFILGCRDFMKTP